MRKVVLTLSEQKKFEVIKSVVDHDSNKQRAVIELGVTRRTVDRMMTGYRKHGKVFFSHKNKGRKPVTAIPKKTKQLILDLYNTKYYDCSYEFFTELLAKEEGIFVSISTVRNILMDVYILSPKAKRKTVRRVKKELETKRDGTTAKRKKMEIDRVLIDIEDAHPRRPRSAHFGEEIQMDASVFPWFSGTNTHLHAAIDDSTGALLGLHFDYQETLSGYYNVFSQILNKFGIPYKFRTDRRTVFEYKLTGSSKAEEDTFTQFSYACKQLGVHIETTSVPQGKARVERVFGTLQGRLPILLRLAGARTIEAANEFLTSYVDEFNKQFALDYNAIPSVFENQPSDEKINLTLAILTERTVDSGHAVKFSCKYHKLLSSTGERLYLPKGTKGLVIKAFDGSLFFSVHDTVMALEEIPVHEAKSPEFTTEKEKPPIKKRYVPPLSHPWRGDTFKKFLKKQHHRNAGKAAS